MYSVRNNEMLVAKTETRVQPNEVWFAKFPYEEDSSVVSGRPVIVLHADDNTVLAVKLTCHTARGADKFDTPLTNWQDAHLNRPSVARISKTVELSTDMLIAKIGELNSADAVVVESTYSKFASVK